MKYWLDNVTGRVTMYRLVLIMLALTGVNALVISAVGQLFYTPIELAASGAVAIGVSVASSWLAARVVRTTLHPESSLITGLIIFLIMQPTVEPLGLVGIGLASLIASASKYLIAIRGRHIFNPAALGAFVIGLVGLAYPAWWVGTPLLQPIIVIGAFLVLYRSQRLTMGLVFVVVAAAVRIGITLASGGAIDEALSFTFLSSQIFFFAGFMLSEPLTLAPRNRQRLAIAVLVALLFAIPFSIGPLYSSPLLALLVGNLVSFLFGQRRSVRMTLLEKNRIGPTTWELSFQPARPVRFSPGQYMELTIPHRKADFRGSRRYLSIASAPSEDGPITFAITVPERSSSFKRALLDLEPGAEVRGTGVGGDFALPRDTDEPLLLVAGGIGITPFASQLAHAAERGEKRDVVVAYATSTPGPLPYADLLERSGARVVLYGTLPDTLPCGWEYGGEGRVTGERLAAAVPDVARRRAFVSGPPALVNDLRAALRSQGTRRVHTDYFSGY